MLCNIGYPSVTQLNFKFRENSFVHNIHSSCPIVLKFCTDPSTTTTVLCTKVWNDWSDKQYVLSKRDFERFGRKMSLETNILYCIAPWAATVILNNRNESLYLTCSCIKPATTVYPKKYAHGFCFAVLCCGYTLTDFPISIRLNSLALWQSNDCPSASKATLMNMDTYFMWIHYERLHNHNKAKHNKTVCIFLGIYCMYGTRFEVF